MIIKKLNVSCLRTFAQAEFNFQPGMNLLVGVNGVGKTTALEALRICLSKVFPEITASKSRKEGFTSSDIKIGTDALDVSCQFEFNSTEFSLLLNKKKSSFIENYPGSVRNTVTETPDLEQITPAPLKSLFKDAAKSRSQPICVYYSTTRSLIVDQIVKSNTAIGGQAAAFSDALNEKREFNLRIFASWYKAQEELGEENPKLLRHTAVLRDAVKSFLPEFDNLHVVTIDDAEQFVIDKNGIPLFIIQLSDGERGILTLLMDIARRLSQANPEADDPLQEGTGIILIDELDLHLHPKWQRTVVQNLTKTFPKLQFICATHSPQIIPSVEPEHVQLLRENEILVPDRTFGIDSNWILRFLMEADERPEESLSAIKEVEGLITDGEFEKARSQMGKFKRVGLDLPEWSMLEARIARLEIIDKEK